MLPDQYQSPWYVRQLRKLQRYSTVGAQGSAVVGLVLLVIHLVMYGVLIGIDTINGVNPAACRANGTERSNPYNWDYNLWGNCVNLKIHGIMHNLMIFPGLSLFVLGAIAATSGTALGCGLLGPSLDGRARDRHQLALDAADTAARNRHYLLISVKLRKQGRGRRVVIEYCDYHRAQDQDEPRVRAVDLPLSGVSWAKSGAPGTVNFPASGRLGIGTRAILMTRTRPEGIPEHEGPVPLRERVLAADFNQ